MKVFEGLSGVPSWGQDRKLSQVYFIGTFLPLIIIMALYKSLYFSSPLKRGVKSKGLQF